MVESLVFTNDLQKALGIVCKDAEGNPIVGWFVGMKITDDQAWADTKAGKYKMFSIGGEGVRVPIEVS